MFLLSNISAQTISLSQDELLAKNIFKELIEINTTHSTGNTTIAAEAMAKRLIAAGFAENDIKIVGPEALNQNLVLRWHGSGGGRPILFLAHLDVVEARKEDWTTDPFKFTELDSFYYGRGTIDMKNGAAVLVANFIRLKRLGFTPDRDLILALTAGEEVGDLYNGVEWLIANQRPLIDAEFCINLDAGGGRLENGKRTAFFVQTSEKGVLNLNLEVKNSGGHSSRPSKNNAIYHLAKGLTNLSAYDFPVELNRSTKSYFSTISSIESGQLAADMNAILLSVPDTGAVNRLSTIPFYNAMMRSTCVATMLEAGHAITALPQTAIAKLNCRILPGVKQEYVVQQINHVLGDSQIVVTVLDTLKKNPATELNPVLMKTVKQLTEKFWPGIPLIPAMSTGATDGLFLRGAGIPCFGISGVFSDVAENRAHGKDERILKKSFYDALEYEFALIKALTSLK